MHSVTLEACLPKTIAAGAQKAYLKLEHGPVFLNILQPGKYKIQILKLIPPVEGLKKLQSGLFSFSFHFGYHTHSIIMINEDIILHKKCYI